MPLFFIFNSPSNFQLLFFISLVLKLSKIHKCILNKKSRISIKFLFKSNTLATMFYTYITFNNFYVYKTLFRLRQQLRKS